MLSPLVPECEAVISAREPYALEDCLPLKIIFVALFPSPSELTLFKIVSEVLLVSFDFPDEISKTVFNEPLWIKLNFKSDVTFPSVTSVILFTILAVDCAVVLKLEALFVLIPELSGTWNETPIPIPSSTFAFVSSSRAAFIINASSSVVLFSRPKNVAVEVKVLIPSPDILLYLINILFFKLKNNFEKIIII